MLVDNVEYEEYEEEQEQEVDDTTEYDSDDLKNDVHENPWKQGPTKRWKINSLTTSHKTLTVTKKVSFLNKNAPFEP